jgi:hypothetical protein
MRTAGPLVLALAAAGLVLPIRAQTPGQMEYERQQREYSRAQEQQRQEQQRLPQTMNENARRQQEESARAARGAATPPGTGGPAMSGGGGVPGGAQGAQLEQARQAWLKRPPLAPANNPLIGTWSRPASATARSQDPFAQLGAMMKGGLCEVLFSSDGLFEFKPTALVGIDKRTRRADVLDQLEYRGDAKRVVVIPKASFKLMVFDFNGPDRITWAGQNCTLQRVGAQAHAGSRR